MSLTLRRARFSKASLSSPSPWPRSIRAKPRAAWSVAHVLRLRESRLGAASYSTRRRIMKARRQRLGRHLIEGASERATPTVRPQSNTSTPQVAALSPLARYTDPSGSPNGSLISHVLHVEAQSLRPTSVAGLLTVSLMRESRARQSFRPRRVNTDPPIADSRCTWRSLRPERCALQRRP